MEKSGEFRESLQETEWAWIAGFIDGEGHMGIRRGYTENKRKHHSWSKKEWIWYQPRLSVYNTDESAIAFISRAFNCKCHERKKQTCNLKSLFYVEIAGRKALKQILLNIIPYLRIKKDLAVLLYRLVCLPRGSGYKKEMIWKEFDQLAEKIGQKEVGRRNHISATLSQATG